MADESRDILTARLVEWAKHYDAKAEAVQREHQAARPERKSSDEILAEAARKHSPAWRGWEAKRDKAIAAKTRHVQAQDGAPPIGRFLDRLLTRRAQRRIDQAETQLAWLRGIFQASPNYYVPDQAREVDAVQRAASDIRSTNEGNLASWHETYQYWPYRASLAHSLYGDASSLRKAAELAAKGSDFLRLDEIPELPASVDPNAPKAQEAMDKLLHRLHHRVTDAETALRLASNPKPSPTPAGKELSEAQQRAVALREKAIREAIQEAKPKSAKGADASSDPLDRIREREFDPEKKKKREINRYLGPER